MSDERHEHEPVRDQILYSFEQGARVLGISKRMLDAYAAAGEIKTRKLGARRLIHRRDLEKFALRDHETPLKSVDEQVVA